MQGSPKRTPKSSSKSTAQRKPPPTGADQAEKNFLQARDQERASAWSAIRMATLVAMAQRARSLLIGDPALTSLAFKSSLKEHVPEFAMQDLLYPKTG